MINHLVLLEILEIVTTEAEETTEVQDIQETTEAEETTDIPEMVVIENKQL
jgi:hypothetical protein